jgi:molybdenum cofactor guanylyltransferase
MSRADDRADEAPFPFSGAVLTGGTSRRMGTDKALLAVGGRPMAAIAADALWEAGAGEVLAVGGTPATLAALTELGLDPRPDLHPGAGPLAGVVTALSCAVADEVAVLACDLPNAAAGGVLAVVGALIDGDAHAAVPVVGGRPQPLHAAYRRDALPLLDGRFRAGERSLLRALEALDVVEVSLADIAWAHNANRPADLPAALVDSGRAGPAGQTGPEGDGPSRPGR